MVDQVAEADRDRLLRAVRHPVDQHPDTAGHDRFVFPHRTEPLWCRVGPE